MDNVEETRNLLAENTVLSSVLGDCPKLLLALNTSTGITLRIM